MWVPTHILWPQTGLSSSAIFSLYHFTSAAITSHIKCNTHILMRSSASVRNLTG